MDSEPVVLSKRQIEQVFDGAAAAYDCAGPSIFTQFGERLVRDIPISRGMRVLDVATGKGAVLIPMARKVGEVGRVVGIDISQGILEEAQRKVAVLGLNNVELCKMDAEHLEFADRSFDVVTCAFALFMFPEMDLALSEMHRVCKPGGYIAVTYFNKTPPPFDPGWRAFARMTNKYGISARMPQQLGLAPEELEAILVKAGFTMVKTESEVNDIVYKTAEDWWSFLLTLGSRVPILSMDEKTRERFKEEYLAGLAGAGRGDGLHMTTGVVYGVGRSDS
jgi:ubiquinone/menaquinone biosynthesis C-methylase UbiE